MGFESVSITAVLLSTLALNPAPWKNIRAYSEQRPPLYLGATPREIALHSKTTSRPSLPLFLKTSAEEGARAIRQGLLEAKLITAKETVQLEAWPAQDDLGHQTWAFARWKKVGPPVWSWIDTAEVERFFVPKAFDPSRKEDHAKIFTDVLRLESLYDKPVFGECIWTDKAGSRSWGAWFDFDKISSFQKNAKFLKDKICRTLPQISRFNGKPFSFVLNVSDHTVSFAQEVEWAADKSETAVPAGPSKPLIQYPNDFADAYKKDLKIFSGESVAVFRASKKNNADSENELSNVVSYLEERYKKLGIKTKRDSFQWRGKNQSNLIATIAGVHPDHAKTPVLLADHIDTAFSEDVYEKTKKRVANPGADDNATATAALLRAAELLKNSKPQFDIVFLHFTGEEYPADSLGARHFVSSLLKSKREIKGLILADMIGYRSSPSDQVFQINTGNSPESIRLAQLAERAAQAVSNKLKPVILRRFDPKSYLYNTDGIIFSDAGYPVILVNEHINKLENFDRPHYHQSTDTSDKIDWDYAVEMTKVIIETAARFAAVKMQR